MANSYDYGCSWLSNCFKPTRYAEDRRTSVAVATKKLEDVLKVPILDEWAPDSKYLPLTFVPDSVIGIITTEGLHTLPYIFSSVAVILVVDVCGFTSMTESYCQTGLSGIEELASILNGFMSTLAAMLLSSGGDILGFAGDAFLVYWKEEGDENEKNQVVETVFNCALSLQTHKSLQSKNLDGALKVKIAIAKGEITTWILGSKDFMMFAVAGSVLIDVHKAGEMCSAGDIIITSDIYKCLRKVKANTFDAVQLPEGFVKIYGYEQTQKADETFEPSRNEIFEPCSQDDIEIASKFSIRGIREVQIAAELNYLSELTLVNIVFVFLKDVDIEEPDLLDKSFDIVLDCASKHGGVLNKALLFDKGCTYLVVFGLPGLKHANDAARSLLCSNEIVNKLADIDIFSTIGVTTGTCFCGLVGHPQRQEYTVIGSSVNLAARLMCSYPDEPITMDADTFHLSRHELGNNSFVEMPPRYMKGFEFAGSIYGYRIQNRKAQAKSSLTIPSVSSSILPENKDLEMLTNCVKLMCYKDERAIILAKNLLPVVIVEGESKNAKNYFMYFATEAAAEMNYRIYACCTLPFCKSDDYFTAALLFQKMLQFTPEDTRKTREQKILDVLSEDFENHLYLLNHLFHVEFPNPKFVNTLKKFRNSSTHELFKAMYKKICKEDYTLVAIEEIDYMDEQSFHLFRELAELENILIVMSLSGDFKEPSISASLMYLKAHTHIDLRSKNESYTAPLICWFLSLVGVHKEIVLRLREETEGDFELLQEICLSTPVTKSTVLIPLNKIDRNSLDKYYICNFKKSEDEQLFVLDIKPEIHDLQLMLIPSTISDAVKDSLNFLSVQDRLILKQAAVIGPNFNQSLLKAVSPKLTDDQVTKSINNLMKKNIFASNCTSYYMLDNLPSTIPFKHIHCYNVCFCSKFSSRSVLRNYRIAHCRVGPYHYLTFRTGLFRQWIRAFMTKEQFQTMHIEIAQGLEMNAMLCTFCQNYAKKEVKIEVRVSETKSEPTKISSKHCVCLQIRSKLYKIISSVYEAVDVKLLTAYFLKKAAQASNDINYPLQALSYAEKAETVIPKFKPYKRQSFCFEENHFDLSVLLASLKRTQARSCLILEDAYYAIVHAHEALSTLGIELVYFFGVFKPQEFRAILKWF